MLSRISAGTGTDNDRFNLQCRIRGSKAFQHFERSLGATEPPLTISHHRNEGVVAGHPSHGSELGQRVRVTRVAIRRDSVGFPHARHATCQTFGFLGELQSRLGLVILQRPLSGHKKAPDTVAHVFRQGAQLVDHRRIELGGIDPLGNAGPARLAGFPRTTITALITVTSLVVMSLVPVLRLTPPIARTSRWTLLARA